MPYHRRALDTALEQLMPHVAAIAIDGAKAVGKTETAMQHASVNILLDNPQIRPLVEANPMLERLPEGTVLVDEWQKIPSTWDAVRRAVDSGAPPGRFRLTGSASPQPGVDTHSGAGRILSIHMRPMGLFERYPEPPSVSLAGLMEGDLDISGTTDMRLTDYVDAIAASGFPGLQEHPPAIRTRMLDSYIGAIVDRDLPEAGFKARHPETLRRWLAAYGAASSTTASYSKILDTATSGDGQQPAKSTTAAYRDYLTSIWVLDPVPAWTSARNPFTQAARSPKHQLVDPALALRMQRLTARDLLDPRGAHATGPLFESLATLSLRAAATASGYDITHLRTSHGRHEIDLIAESPDGRLVAFEVKLSAYVEDKDVVHLRWFREQLPYDVADTVILFTGQQAYRRTDGVACVPLALLGP